jgi:hypothetical protein
LGAQLIAASVSEIIRILSSVDKNFTEVDELAPSLPGLIQRLNDIIKIQFETREKGDVAEFDFIGLSCRNAINLVGTELWNCTTILIKKAGDSKAGVMGQRTTPCLSNVGMS